MLSVVEHTRRKQLDWFHAILEQKGWRPKRLADEAGINHSTLSKWLNDPDNIARLSSSSVDKIAEATGVPPYYTEPIMQSRGMAEVEAEPFIFADSDPITTAVAAIVSGRPGIDAWILRSRAMETAGFMPGDVLIVDLNAAPLDGDAVCAQLYDRAGRAETAFRIYESPFLIAASQDPALRRPLLIDNDRAQVRGVVITSLRPRLAH